MSRGQIVVVDDEIKILEVVASYLVHAGYSVLRADNGRFGLELIQRENPGLVVLDLMLPDLSGEEICRIVRQSSTVPILMLTAKVEEESILRGFNLGADDYLTKPFSPRELVVRVAALLKRSTAQNQTLAETILFSADGKLVLDRTACHLEKQGSRVELTATEFRLLAHFLSHPGRVYSREELVDHAFGEDFSGDIRTVDAHIKNLRHKIEDDPRQPTRIHTVHGFGYRFEGQG